MARGDLDAAIDYFREALASNPGDEAVRHNLGFVQNEQAIQFGARGDYAAAVTLLEAAARNRPDDDVILSNLAAYRAALDQQRQEARWQQQLGTAKQVIGGMLNNLADAWGTANSSNSDAATDGMDFAAPDGAAVESGGLEFVAPGEPVKTVPPANQDSSVVDLTFMDPDAPMVVNPRTVKENEPTPSQIEQPVQTEQLKDAIKSGELSGDVRKTEILLDALEIGATDWNASLSYLDQARQKYPDDLAVRDAMTTLMGIVGVLDDGGSSANFGAGLLEPLDVDTGLDYETWALLQRASVKISSANNSVDWQVVHGLLEQAHEKSPEQLRIRDWANYTEGTVIGMQHTEEFFKSLLQLPPDTGAILDFHFEQ